jgi:hypothetical protein
MEPVCWRVALVDNRFLRGLFVLCGVDGFGGCGLSCVGVWVFVWLGFWGLLGCGLIVSVYGECCFLWAGWGDVILELW